MRQTLKFNRQWQRFLRQNSSFLLVILLFIFSMAAPPVFSMVGHIPSLHSQQHPLQLVQQGQSLYQQKQYEQAATVWQQAAAFANQNDFLNQAMALSNLSLTYQKLGKWLESKQAISESLMLLKTAQETPEQQRILAQSLDIQGQLQRAAGQPEVALETWKKAAEIYRKIGYKENYLSSQINQVKALQDLGLYRRACQTLLPALELDSTLCQSLNSSPLDELLGKLEQLPLVFSTAGRPNSLLKFEALHSLGNILQRMGNLPLAETVFKLSLTVAETLQASEEKSIALLSLGNTAQAFVEQQVALNNLCPANSVAGQKAQDALNYYRESAQNSPTLSIQFQAEVNQFILLIEKPQCFNIDFSSYQNLWSSIQEKIETLPVTRTKLYAQIYLTRSLTNFRTKKGQNFSPQLIELISLKELTELLQKTLAQSQKLGDRKIESYALGSLGKLSELNQQWKDAKQLTESALLLARSANASDVSYQWEWQLGRIFKMLDNRDAARAAYSQAVQSLQSLRKDFIVASLDTQFTFKESVEPIYRELIELLLQPGVETKQSDIIQARQALEALYVAELDNFFQDTCLEVQPVQVEDIDPKAAVFYPIILQERLDIIIKLPGKPLRYYSTPINANEVESTTNRMRQGLTSRRWRNAISPFLEQAQKVYDWLIRPIENELAESGVQTLVFVLDGSLRNIPMASLYDGQHYLVEKYNLALAPSLQLVDAKPFRREGREILAGALSQAQPGFGPLPYVEKELQEIATELPGQQLLNESFTKANLEQRVRAFPFPIIHLATHGEFGSQAENTFILAWDGRINAREFERLLRGNRQEARPIELLVLSACRTALGDKRAPLGLAGVAVRAGARSTLASLWRIDDEATAFFMARFYHELSQNNITKAEALRRAQVAFLKDAKFSHPYFWTAFVLVGNWL